MMLNTQGKCYFFIFLTNKLNFALTLQPEAALLCGWDRAHYVP